MNFSILFPGRLGNQLILLYHIYETYGNKIDKIYAPYFDEYSHYFNISNLCDESYYNNNKGSFLPIEWYPNSCINNYVDDKFNDLKLKPIFEHEIDKIIKTEFTSDNMVAVHIRQADFKIFENGKYYFDTPIYLQKTQQKILDWGLENYKILIFSDSDQSNIPNTTFASKITNSDVLDLFLMAHCNYFIRCVFSTFSQISKRLSEGMGKFKNEYTLNP